MNKDKEIRKQNENETERLCIGKCGLKYPPTHDHFFFRKSAKNGKEYPSSMCKTCEREKSAAARRARYATKEGKELIDSQTAVYRAKPEKRAAITKRLRDLYATDDEYRSERLANAQMWRKANRERRRELGAAWYQKNKARLREEWNERFRSDPAFRLRNNLRHAIWEALRVNNGNKAGRSILKFLPYTMDELKSHLESLWEPWMSWDNYGVLDPAVRTWQIDHVIPQVSLPFDDFLYPNFIACWSLSNLRPMDSKMNLEKGSR